MRNERLTEAVERLLRDRRLRARFRRDPEQAVARFGLSSTELKALKEGRADELLHLGVDPHVVYQNEAVAAPLEPWLLRNARKVAPAVFTAALLTAAPATASAVVTGRPKGKVTACDKVEKLIARNKIDCPNGKTGS